MNSAAKNPFVKPRRKNDSYKTQTLISTTRNELLTAKNTTPDTRNNFAKSWKNYWETFCLVLNGNTGIRFAKVS